MRASGPMAVTCASGPNHDVIDCSAATRHEGDRAAGGASSSTLDIGTLDALAGVVAIAIERAQFLAERDAAELVRQKADLAATLLASLSHDLRTPLTAIRVAVENLRDELPAQERREQAERAIAELDRLTRLFQDILDMARIDAAAIRVDRAMGHGGRYRRRRDRPRQARARRASAAGRRRRRRLEVEIDPRLASGALSHLLENAAQYSPRRAARSSWTHASSDDGLHISVTDQGPGLDPGELDHLFERFYRGQSARQTTFGTGMGLSITRGLLAAAGGRVWAENVPGAGAKFSIVVPGRSAPAPVPQ